jgi:hypothetical protein
MATVPHSNVKVYIFHDPEPRVPQVLRIHNLSKMDVSQYIPVAGLFIPPGEPDKQIGHALDEACRLTQGNWVQEHKVANEVFVPAARATRRGDIMVENNNVWIHAGPYFAIMEGQNAARLLLRLPDPVLALNSVIEALNCKYTARTALHTKGYFTPSLEEMWQIESHLEKADGTPSQRPVHRWNEDAQLSAQHLREKASEPVGKLTRLEAWIQAVAHNHETNIELYRLKPVPVYDPFDL